MKYELDRRVGYFQDIQNNFNYQKYILIIILNLIIKILIRVSIIFEILIVES